MSFATGHTKKSQGPQTLIEQKVNHFGLNFIILVTFQNFPLEFAQTVSNPSVHPESPKQLFPNREPSSSEGQSREDITSLVCHKPITAMLSQSVSRAKQCSMFHLQRFTWPGSVPAHFSGQFFNFIPLETYL